MPFTFDTITMKSWPKITKIGPKNTKKNNQFILKQNFFMGNIGRNKQIWLYVWISRDVARSIEKLRFIFFKHKNSSKTSISYKMLQTDYISLF